MTQDHFPFTTPALWRRIDDAALATIPDPRGRQGRIHSWVALLGALVIGMATRKRGLRDVEHATKRLHPKVRTLTQIKRPISDTKLRDTIVAIAPGHLRLCLHRYIKAEHRRGCLAPTRLPFGVAAIDGKEAAITDSIDHPNVMTVEPAAGEPYGRMRFHRTHLISSASAPCIDQRPIEGHTNEAGAIIDTVNEVLRAYGRTNLVEAFIFDAGNNHLACASYINGRSKGYIGRLKDDQPTLMDYARRRLGGLGAHQTQQTQGEETPRTKVVRRMWRLCLSGGVHTWEHARQLVRIERVCFKREDRDSPWVETSRGERYWISNLDHKRLDEHGWMSVCRYYWRIENEGNWSADALWSEDARRTPWASWPDGIEVVGLLRMLGMSIVGVLRAMKHQRDGGGRPPSWSMCTEEVMLALALGRGEGRACS